MYCLGFLYKQRDGPGTTQWIHGMLRSFVSVKTTNLVHKISLFLILKVMSKIKNIRGLLGAH